MRFVWGTGGTSFASLAGRQAHHLRFLSVGNVVFQGCKSKHRECSKREARAGSPIGVLAAHAAISGASGQEC